MSSAIDIGGPATGPLAGVKVIDISTVVMGPLATQILGDFGADVIRIEPPRDMVRDAAPGLARHPGMGHIFLQVNRNKRSVGLNLKDESDREVLLELLADADVLVTNMRGAALDRLGLGYEQLRDRFPRLVYAHAQGFNANSTQAARPAYDEVIQAVTGLVNMQERATDTLEFMPTLIADKTAALYLLGSLLAALYDQSKTGAGQLVSLAMADVMISINLVEHMAGRVFEPPTVDIGNPLSLSPAHAAMRTADGGAISAVPYTPAEVQTLLIGAGRADLASAPHWSDPASLTPDDWDEGLHQILANSTAKTTDEWVQYLETTTIPFGIVVDLADLPDDPYVRELGLVDTVEHPTEGRINVVANPVNFSRTPANIRRHAETAGASTDEVLAEARRRHTELV